jgi:homoserine dehydrogenase
VEKIKIGLLGLGNVGSGVWNILNQNEDEIVNFLGKKLEVKKILVRNPEKVREINIPENILTTDIRQIIEDPEIDIVVEVMGGIHPAVECLKASLQNKKHVVTANKAAIATYGQELHQLALEQGVQLRYEASVCGGIPIINTLKNGLAANKIEEIVGIVNGTTNFILTQMSNQGMEFEEALKLAQDKGYAEADPSSDIYGEDAAFKLSILTSIAFNKNILPTEIPREGVTKISKKDIEYAFQLGYKIKLLATVARHKDFLECHVQPTLIPKTHPLAAVNDEFNALFVKGNAVGELMLYGKGAGSLATGSAVMGDILSIGKNIEIKAQTVTTKKKEDITLIGEGSGQYYVRFQVKDHPGVLGKIATLLGEYNVSLESVVQTGRNEERVPLIFITHEIERSLLNKALEEIVKYDEVIEIASIMKIKNL